MYKYDSFLFKAPQSAFRTPHWYLHYPIHAFYGYLYTGRRILYCIWWLVITCVIQLNKLYSDDRNYRRNGVRVHLS